MTLLADPESVVSDVTDSVASFRVVLIDGQQIFRQAVRALLSAEPDLTVVGEAGRLPDALQVLGSQDPDVVLSDLKLPDSTDMQLVPKLRTQCPRAAFVVLTDLHAHDHRAAARRAGALGYLPKQSGRVDVLAAIREVAAGRHYRKAPQVLRPATVGAGRIAASAARLTERQREVLRAMALGYRTRQIAAMLGVSVQAVYRQRERLRETLELNNTAALTRFAVHAGLAGDAAARR